MYDGASPATNLLNEIIPSNCTESSSVLEGTPDDALVDLSAVV